MYSWIARDAGMEEMCAEGGSSYLLLNLGFKACSEYSLFGIGLPLSSKAGFRNNLILAFRISF